MTAEMALSVTAFNLKRDGDPRHHGLLRRLDQARLTNLAPSTSPASQIHQSTGSHTASWAAQFYGRRDGAHKSLPYTRRQMRSTRPGRADRARAGSAGGQRRPAGPFGRRYREARQGDARRPAFRLGRPGHRAASRRRDAQGRARRATDPCALQGHAAGDQRRRRRPYPDDVQPDPDRAADDPGRQGAADRPVHGAAHRGAARRAAAEREPA